MVLLNLVENASKYGKQNGSITCQCLFYGWQDMYLSKLPTMVLELKKNICNGYLKDFIVQIPPGAVIRVVRASVLQFANI